VVHLYVGRVPAHAWPRFPGFAWLALTDVPGCDTFKANLGAPKAAGQEIRLAIAQVP